MISSAVPLPKGRRAISRSITALITLTGRAFGLIPMRLLTLKTAVDADRLVGADDLFDRSGFSKRKQQPLVGDVLAVAILHRRNRIGGPLVRQAGAVRGDHARITMRADGVVEIAIGPLVGIDMLVAIGGRQPGAFMCDHETRDRHVA